ncbi:MAG: OmpH family outer membrane protein [Nitrospira sp.]|nr:OmpH family outer membrane protein [Nitrospira sp.]
MQGRHQLTSHTRGNVVLSLLGWFIIQSLLFGLPHVLAEESIQIAIIDPQAVLENSNAGQKALATLKEHVMVRQKLLETDEVEIQKLEQQLQGGTGRSETETQVLRGELQTKIQDYQRRRQTFQQEVQDKQKNLMVDYMKKIEGATKVVAERRGFSLVIDKGNEAIMQIVIYSTKGMDITDEVVKEFNKTYK